MLTRSRGVLATLATWTISTIVAIGPLDVLAAEPPIELGKVRWGRDHAAGVAASKNSGKPLLVLFQEVPG